MEHRTLNFGVYDLGAQHLQKGLFLEAEGIDIELIKETDEFTLLKQGKHWKNLMKVCRYTSILAIQAHILHYRCVRTRLNQSRTLLVYMIKSQGTS